MKNENINYSRIWNLVSIPFNPKLTRTLNRVDKFMDIEPSFLARKGIRAIIVDVDGTVVEHGGEILRSEVIEKIRDFIRNQIGVCIFSNNSTDRAKQFIDLGIGIINDVPQKPHPQGFLTGMKQHLGLEDPTKCAMVGDNFNTDGGANNVGMHFIHVKPIPGEEPLWVKLTRGYSDIWARFHDALRKSFQVVFNDGHS